MLFFAPVLFARTFKAMHCPLLASFRPREFGGQNGQPGRNDEKGRAGQDNHGETREEHDRADDPDTTFFQPRFQLQQVGAKPVLRLEAAPLIAASGWPC